MGCLPRPRFPRYQPGGTCQHFWALSMAICMKRAGYQRIGWPGRCAASTGQTEILTHYRHGWRYIRTWTYVAQRKGWVEDENHWRGATRAVEDRLSDALHERLTQRFVDRRTSVLLRRLKPEGGHGGRSKRCSGEVTVEGEFVGRLEGFRFIQDKGAAGQEAKTRGAGQPAGAGPAFSPEARTVSTTRRIPRSTLPNRAG